ncbi:hypothetical protein ABVT39_021670 [Epinephelus coioides]
MQLGIWLLRRKIWKDKDILAVVFLLAGSPGELQYAFLLPEKVDRDQERTWPAIGGWLRTSAVRSVNLWGQRELLLEGLLKEGLDEFRWTGPLSPFW